MFAALLAPPVRDMTRGVKEPCSTSAPVSTSPVIGCKCGSMQTSLHTSDRQPPTVSGTSLCRMEGNPPFGQERACSYREASPTFTVGRGVGWEPSIAKG